MGAKNLRKLLAIDVECTCWDKDIRPAGESREIIEIGICQIDTVNNCILNKDSILVKPVISKISQYCTDLTGWTQEEVDKGLSFSDACTMLIGSFDTNSYVWCSYGDFDREIFWHQCNSFGVEYPFGRGHINVKSLLSILHGFPKEYGLTTAMKMLDMEFEGTNHRGVDDAYNVARIMLNLSGKIRR